MRRLSPASVAPVVCCLVVAAFIALALLLPPATPWLASFAVGAWVLYVLVLALSTHRTMNEEAEPEAEQEIPTARQGATPAAGEPLSEPGHAQVMIGGPLPYANKIEPTADHRRALEAENVHFTAYRPSRVRPLEWYKLLVYAHKGRLYESSEGVIVDPIAQVTQHARTLLGPNQSSYENSRAASSVPITPFTSLTIRPWIEFATIKPESFRLSWEDAFEYAQFQFALPEIAAGRALPGVVRIYDGILLVGEIHFAIMVNAAAPPADAEPNEESKANRYRKIFASYSHADTAVVRSVMSYVQTTGDRYLIDVQDLRAGEVWNKRIAELIGEADVFQLFWSSNSMRSPFVRSEWEYALGLNRRWFVRPMHWETPIPEDPHLGLPPASLKALQFAPLAIELDKDSRTTYPYASTVRSGPLTSHPVPTISTPPSYSPPSPPEPPPRPVGISRYSRRTLIAIAVFCLGAILTIAVLFLVVR